jgi:hypothetical protein
MGGEKVGERQEKGKGRKNFWKRQIKVKFIRGGKK